MDLLPLVSRAASRKHSRVNRVRIVCHWGGGRVVPGEGTVAKASSNTTWNYGDIFPVVVLRTKGTSDEWCGENPTKSPRRERGLHFGILFPSCSVGSST